MIWVIDGHGGFFTSQGMRDLAARLSQVGYSVKSGFDARRDYIMIKEIREYINTKNTMGKVVLVAYSLGCNAAIRYANHLKDVTFDLIIGYDPTRQYTLEPIHSNVKRAICYHNTFRAGTSIYFGGDRFKLADGNDVTKLTTYDVCTDHTFVQNMESLHQLTFQAIAETYRD